MPPDADSNAVYGVPTVPFGSDTVVTARLACSETVRVNDISAVSPAESVINTVNPSIPLTWGVPEIVPEAEIESPAGSDVEEKDAVPIPPVAASVVW